MILLQRNAGMNAMQVTAKDGKKDDVSVIRFHGNLEFVAADALDKVVEQLLKSGQIKIVVDLSDTSYISSRGWGVFLSNIKEMREKGGDLKLAGMLPDTYQVFRVLEFGMFLNAYVSVEEAAGSFKIGKSNSVAHV
jgi:anti-sigma B factor antagonist